VPVASAEKQPELKPAPAAIDPSESHRKAELQKIREMALALQAHSLERRNITESE
jgi:hypothetical protein